MPRGRASILSVWVAAGVLILLGPCAKGTETEEQLVQRIQRQHNPIKKAKEEIKLASLKLGQVRDAYSKGQTEAGAKLLKTFVDEMNTSWKILKGSGRTAAKQPDGFRELEIALREGVRSLQDLGRDVSYFDRAPLTNAAQKLDQTHNEVLRALFPGVPPRPARVHSSGSAAPAGPAEVR